MISRMQLPREMYMGGGISNLSYPSYGYADGGITNLPNYMGGGYVDEYGRQKYGFGKFVKKITRPIAKVLDKIVPNEIKPILPFLAAAVPFAAPAFLPGMTAMKYAAISAAANAASQLSQEGAEKYGLNPVSLGLSALSGYGAAPGSGADLTTGKILGTGPMGDPIRYTDLPNVDVAAGFQGPPLPVSSIPGATTDISFLNKIENLARGVGSFGADTLGKGTEAFQNMTGPGEITGSDLLTLGKAALPGQAMAAGDLAYFEAQRALDEYDQQQAALGAMGVANTEARKSAIRKAMGLAGFTNDEIDSTILKFKFATGGRVGYQQGGIMNLGGLEMDLRAKGGFVPIGKKEKADDVPARLSKNEFVFTAKAVKGAGNGDIRKGAKKMYQLMRQYEATA